MSNDLGDDAAALGLRVRPTHRRILGVSLPIMVAGLSETLIDVIDAIFLARVGVVELGAVALADAIYEGAIFLTLGLVDGLQILIARRAGETRAREIGHVFSHGLIILGAISIVLMIAIRMLGPMLTGAVIGSAAVREAADAFLRVIAFAVPFESMNLAFAALFIGLSRTRVLVGATAILAAVNITLDYCLVFGHWGAPRLGIEGAALASVAAEAASFLFLVGYTLRRVDVARYHLFDVGRWKPALARLIVLVSSPAMLDALVESLRWFLFFVIVERVSEEALAGSNIVYSFYTLFLIPLGGIAETACSMVSNVIGQGRARLMRPLATRAVTLAYLTVLPFAVVAFAIPEVTLLVFTSDPVLIAEAATSMRVIACGMFVTIPAGILTAAVVGTGDTPAALAIEILVSLAVLALVYLTLLTWELPLAFAWMAEIGGALVGLLLAAAWLVAGRWRRLYL